MAHVSSVNPQPTFVPKTKRGSKSDVEVIRQGGLAGDAVLEHFARHGKLPVSELSPVGEPE